MSLLARVLFYYLVIYPLIALVGLTLLGIGTQLVRWIRRPRRVQTTALPFTEEQFEKQRERILLPPDGNWCGCCGRPAPAGARWCWQCLEHVDAEAARAEDATWYAQHGTVCPFIDLPDGSWVRPDATDDLVPEGLGAGIMRRHHSPVSDPRVWSEADIKLFQECERGIRT